MEGSLVYSAIAISSTDGVVHIGRHTKKIAFFNNDNTENCVVKLNGHYSIVIPHSPTNGSHRYTEIEGDYTTFEVITVDAIVSVYAIG